MNAFNPFSKKKIEWIFERINDGDDKVIRRESTALDFKENFNFNALAEYGKFGTSFANRKGGYLVFGIKDKPHLLLGMQNEQFENVDAEKITTRFNEYFSPSLEWDLYVHELDGKKFGLIYFFESLNKPIISLKTNNKGHFSEGDIYYRYSGQSRKIRYSELNEIIENKIKKEKEDWLDFLKNAMQFKPDSALLLDLNSGTINSNDHSILIDEKILEKLKFIKEGDFSEKKGAPTLKLIGAISENVQTHEAKIVEKKVPKPFAITTENLIDSFLSQNCEYPIEYLKQFCYESSSYLPIWYFILCSKKSIDEVDMFWLALNDVKEATRNKLLQRLVYDNVDSHSIGKLIDIKDNANLSNIKIFDDFVKETRLKLRFAKSRDITIERSLIYKLITENNENYMIEELIDKKRRQLLEAISHLPIEIVFEKKEWILNVLNTVHSLKLSTIEKLTYRKSICSVDIKLSKSQMNSDLTEIL